MRTTVSPDCSKLIYCAEPGAGPGGMGQAIWPGDRPALMALPALMLLALARLT
jgi:hypothetical protein